MIGEEAICKANPKPVATYRNLCTFVMDSIFGTICCCVAPASSCSWQPFTSFSHTLREMRVTSTLALCTANSALNASNKTVQSVGLPEYKLYSPQRMTIRA